MEKGCQEAFLLQRVEKVGSRCFAGCGAKPVARGTKCWTDCFYDTVVGPRSNSTVYPDGRLHGMAGADLTAAWLQAFHSSDPAEGGCPDVGRRRWLKTTDDHLEAMQQEQQQQERASPVTITVDTDGAAARHHGHLHGVTIDTSGERYSSWKGDRCTRWHDVISKQSVFVPLAEALTPRSAWEIRLMASRQSATEEAAGKRA